MPHFTENEIAKITSLALEAGAIAADAFRKKNFEIKLKEDGSKVTSADIAVSEFVRENLTKIFPKIPVICEEGSLKIISDDEEVFFLIDPIDGTSSFISDNVEFALNIALVKNKKAVFGLVYAPLFEEGKMAFLDHQNRMNYHRNLVSNSLDHRTLVTDFVAPRPDQNNLRIITSARTKDSDIKNYIAQFHPNYIQNFSVERLSSAVKFFRLLENSADLYLHFRQSMEWDTAAGQALVELSGGKVKKLISTNSKIEIGEDLGYKKPDFLNPPFISFLAEYGKKIYNTL